MRKVATIAMCAVIGFGAGRLMASDQIIPGVVLFISWIFYYIFALHGGGEDETEGAD